MFYRICVLFSVPADIVFVNSACGNAVNEGGSCILTCEPTGGNPHDYTYEWRFKQKYTKLFQVLTGQTSSELTLQSVDYSDAGTYECRVTNLGGESSGTANLDIHC